MRPAGPALLLACAVMCACAGSDATTGRAALRSYDGAPPVIPHELFGIDCVECHVRRSVEIEGYGYSPTMPHAEGGRFAACKQCHVTVNTDQIFVASIFEPLEQDMRAGHREHPGAPPVVPHKLFMRENCLACHLGPGAREAIRTSHPERERCLQCHVGASSPLEWSAP